MNLLFKGKYLLLSFFFLGINLSQAQEAISTPNWKFGVFDFGLGVDQDNYGSMSLNDMLLLAKDPYQMQRDLAGFDEEIHAKAVGASANFNFGFVKPDLRKLNRTREKEIRFGVGFHSPREAMITYKNEFTDTSIVYCNIQGEISLDFAYLFKGMWGKRFQYHYGLGANVASSYNNQMMIIHGKYFGPEEHPSEQEFFEENTEYFDGKAVYFARAFVHAGIGYKFGKRWISGINWRKGVGWQFVEDGNTNFLRGTSSFVLSLKYHFGI